MSGFGAVSGLTVLAAGLSVILMAFVSMIGAASRRLAVDEGRASIKDICELTGILEVGDLQDIFGPPDMNRVWRNLTMERVLAHRRPAGHLMTGRAANWASVGIALLALFFPNELTLLALFFAVLAQCAGWMLSYRLPR